MRYTNEQLLDALHQEFKATQIIPKSTNPPLGTNTLYCNRFGTWNAALLLAGVRTRSEIDSPATIHKQCLQCGNSFTCKTYKESSYCSTLCSNTSRRKDTWAPRKTREQWKLDLRVTSRARPFDELGWDSMRIRVLEDQQYVCYGCGVDEWQGHRITLEVDHIDGVRSNNNRMNLVGLCPNCHSITPTWRGRNKRQTRRIVSDQELIAALKETDNIRQALILVGLAPKGGNYTRATKLMEVLPNW